MSAEWQTVSLGELCLKITDGAHNSPKTVTVGKPMASVKDLTRFGVELSHARLIPIDDFYALVKQGCKPEVGDVLIAKDGNSALDTVCNVDRPLDAVLLSSVAILRPNSERLDSHYLKHYLASPDVITYLKANFISGAAIPRVVLKDFKKAEVKVPPLSTQRAISVVLDSLDDRIALLRETNATLETIAQALFKSWFVDFDPVHAKQQGRAPEGLDEATAALFPDSFEESEFGLVPKGWRVGVLSELAALNPESWSAKNHPSTVAYIDLANTKDNEIGEVVNFAFDAAPSRARRALKHGDTIVGTVRPGNRSFALIYKPASNLTASTGFAVLRPKQSQNTEFVYLSATQDSSIEHLAHVADGGAYPAVRPEIVASLACVCPSDEVISVFHDAAGPLLSKVAENQQQAQTLATLRDTLLPRLISGQLHLPEVETMIEESV